MAKTKPTTYNPNHLVVIKMETQPIPVFTEVRDKEWINYGKENGYPYFLLDLYNKSAKHNAIVNGKTNYVLGSGWESEDAAVESFIAVANPYESLSEVTRKCIKDFELYDGFCLEIVWNKAGKGKPMFYHKDFCNVRSNEENTEFYYSKKWVKVNSYDGKNYPNMKVDDEADFEIYQMYDPNVRTGKQLLYVKGYRPNLGVYPLPNYIGAVKYISVDCDIADYHYNNLKNGFTSTYMLKFYNGVPTEEEQKKIEKQIKEKLAGSGNAGKFIINFSDGKDRNAEVEVIPMSDSDEQFNILNETVQQEIFSGHQVTSPMLFGIKTSGQLGGRTELIEANELFQNTYVATRQRFVEDIFNGINKDLGLGEMNLGQLQPIGLDYFKENIWNVLTDEEKREKVGLEKLPVEIKSSDIVDKLNTMSPLLANKILNSLTSNEIRNLIALPPLPEGTEAPEEGEQEEQFSKKRLVFDQLLWRLGQLGESKKDYEILESLPVKGDFIKEEENLFSKKSEYIEKLTALDRSIVDLIDKDNMMPPEELAKALKKSVSSIKSTLRRLEKNGVFKVKENKEGIIIRTPDAKAIDIIEKKGAKTEEIFVKYSYEWMPGFSDKDLSNSREFCKELLKKDRLYTRAEIESLNNEMDLNVWESRGGWYTKPGTDIHLPYCRHEWVQNLVRKYD